MDHKRSDLLHEFVRVETPHNTQANEVLIETQLLLNSFPAMLFLKVYFEFSVFCHALNNGLSHAHIFLYVIFSTALVSFFHIFDFLCGVGLGLFFICALANCSIRRKEVSRFIPQVKVEYAIELLTFHLFL